MNTTMVLTMTILSLLLLTGTISVAVAQDSWVNQSAMHEARSGLGVAVVDDKIYAIGGASANGFCSFNEQYDPTAGNWTFKASMPTARSDFGIVVFQNKICCIGGYYLSSSGQGGATAANEVYDPATDTWQTKASMPTPELNMRADVVNGKIYVIGGDNNRTLNQVYDPATDSWTTKASIPTAVTSYASAVAEDKIYVFTNGLTQIYNPENDSWSLGTPAPSPIILANAGATTGVSAPEKIYIFGVNAQLPYWQLTTKGFITQSYDPKTDSWTACSPMQTGRYDAGVAVVGDLLYVIGGFTTQFSTSGFDPNPIITYSTVNEQYMPIGYGTVPPVISMVSPQNITYSSGNISLVFTTNKPVAWQAYSLDGQQNVTITGNDTLTNMTNGLHTITVYANDTFGDMGASQTITFIMVKLDAEPFPTATLTVAAVSGALGVVVVVAGLLVYFKKRKH
jgi:N-acetylneuraminic acid mutarotase